MQAVWLFNYRGCVAYADSNPGIIRIQFLRPNWISGQIPNGRRSGSEFHFPRNAEGSHRAWCPMSEGPVHFPIKEYDTSVIAVARNPSGDNI